MSSAEKLLNLYDRPTEPIFMPKGSKDEVFDVPKEYLTERHKQFEDDLSNRFGDNDKVAVKKIKLPNFDIPMKLGRREKFSVFIPYHRTLSTRLIEIFMGMKTVDDFLSAAVYARDRVNPDLFIYALSVAITNRPDTKHLNIPSLAEVFPNKFMDRALFLDAKEESNIIENSAARIPLTIPRDYTATDLDIEHRIAYWREDIGINLHHWHWHLVFPFTGPREIVNKDRRGEMFFYMHQQIQARYNFERLCNNLARVKKLVNFREPIEEGYFPKLDSLNSSRVWPPRMANSPIVDINRDVDQLVFDIQDLERWRDRIYAAIHMGSVVDESGNTVLLTETGGIDILGNLLEASTLTINRNFYGDLHNFCHAILGLIHDPDHRHLETFGVVADPATAMRDPLFYRLHASTDEFFQEHKNTLPPYSVQQLNFAGVRVLGVEVDTPRNPKNTFSTFWQQSDVDLSRGLDFSPRGPVFARYTHLNHLPFTYRIQVQSNARTTGTCRIFLAPHFDERGLPFLYQNQRIMFIEMDKFTVNLNGNRQVIERKSNMSGITIPFERTFRNVDINRPSENTPQLEQFNLCGCGWPEHMLIPKGKVGGFPCQLFVMISNGADDRVDGANVTGNCNDAISFCGARDSLFPDRRPMGYPFDRRPRAGVNTLNQFLTPNMFVQNCSINFSERTITPSQPGRNVRPN